jgi:outer membrane immunogenic protein
MSGDRNFIEIENSSPLGSDRWTAQKCFEQRLSGTVELPVLCCRQAILAAALVAVGLRDQVADRLCQRLELLRQLLRRATGPNQLYHLPAELGRIGWVFPCHRELRKLKQSGVHETGSTSVKMGNIRSADLAAMGAKPSRLLGATTKLGKIRGQDSTPAHTEAAKCSDPSGTVFPLLCPKCNRLTYRNVVTNVAKGDKGGSTMKKFLLTVALSTLVAAPAVATDLAVKRPAPVYQPPPPVVVTHGWTGCYIGGEVGGLWAKKSWSDDVFGEDFGSHTANGWLGGLQAGCDWQFSGNFVIGIQADYDWVSANGRNVNAVHPNFVDESHVRSVGSATARLGYTWWTQFLGYVKGGAAWEHDEYDFSTFGVTGLSVGVNPRLGWTIGVGGEYAFTPWLSGFIEYDFYDFGTRDFTFLGANIRETNNVVKGGINFRFGNWWRR